MDKATLRQLEKSCRLLLPPDQEQRILAQLQEIEEQLYHLPEGSELESAAQRSYKDLRKDVPCPFADTQLMGERRNAQGYYVVKGKAK